MKANQSVKTPHIAVFNGEELKGFLMPMIGDIKKNYKYYKKLENKPQKLN